MRSPQLSFRHIASAVLLASGVAAAHGCGASIIVIECKDGLELCDQDCVDLDLDGEHCGRCDNACIEGGCVDGVCRGGSEPCQGPDCGTCGPGLTACDEECVDLQTDPAHCGSCFATCGGGLPCRVRRCVEACPCGRCDIVELPSELDVIETGTTTGSNDRYASTCTGEGAPDVAHRFIAPVAGQWLFDTSGSSFDTVLGVLSDCFEAACVDDTELGSAAYISMYLEAGEEVLLVVDGFGGSAGDYTLHVYQDGGCVGNQLLCNGVCVDIANDASHCGGCNIACGGGDFCQDFACQCGGPDCNCDFPICGVCTLAGEIFEIPASLSGSTEGLVNAIEPTCTGGGSPEAVHRFLVPFDATYVIDTDGSGFDTVLSILDASSCGEWACNDDWNDLDSRVQVDLFSGQEILISVDGLGDAGPYELHVNAFTFAECGPFLPDGLPLQIEGDTAGSADTFTPTCAPSGSGDQTFTFFAPETRTYTFDSAGSAYRVVLSVLDGECGGVLLACADESGQGSFDARIDVPLTAGQIVTLVVDGFGGEEGPYVVEVR